MNRVAVMTDSSEVKNPWRERLRRALEKTRGKKRWFFPPLLLGLVITALAVVLAPGVERLEESDRALPVRVQLITSADVQPRHTGFGEVAAKHTWKAIAQVGGKVTWRHPDLQTGATFVAGTRLLTIEPLDYEVAETRAAAQLRAALAAQAEVESRSDDLQASLQIEQRAYVISEKRFERNVELSEQGHISKLQLDAEERELLRQQQTLQNLRTELNLLPTQKNTASAKVEEAEAALSKASADLGRTVYKMPFAGRIAQWDVDEGQFVPIGANMLVAQSTQAVEVLLEIPYEQLVARFPSIMSSTASMANPGQLLSARLRYQSDLGDLTWLGQVSRIDTGLDANSRSARVYVDVELGESDTPPAANLYLQVEITGPTLFDHVVIPRMAWHAGTVLIADADDRLERREVSRAYTEGNQVVIRDGLNSGDRLILTDVLFPAVGMSVSPVVVAEESEPAEVSAL
jgi:multidrug efflux pump subunit AcrA (membrane-fusion protein)